jgi:hypothetical protein
MRHKAPMGKSLRIGTVLPQYEFLVFYFTHSFTTKDKMPEEFRKRTYMQSN